MFCPECGEENPDVNKFCRECGKPLECRETSKEKSTSWIPEPFSIIIGMVMFFAIYTIPIVPGPLSITMTLARSAEICSVSASYCPKGQPWIFYLAWLLGLFFLVNGIFHTKEASSE
jgi:hypothetical protein